MEVLHLNNLISYIYITLSFVRYTDDPRQLHRELTEWLGAAGSRHAQSARAIISP